MRAAQSLLGRGDVVAIVVERMERHGDGLCLLERADLNQLEGGGEVRPLGEQPLRGFRGGLGHDRQVARLDGGEEGVEHSEAAPVVLTGVESCFEIREVPDHRPAAEAVDEFLDPRLELADVDRSGLELRRGRLEHGHVADAVDRGPEQGRLADSVLPDEQHRAPRSLCQAFGDHVDDLGAPPREKRGRAVVRRRPHPSDAGEEVDVDASCSPRLEHLTKTGAEQLLVVVEQLPELVGQVGDLVEDVRTQGLSGSQSRADEARDRVVRDALVEYPQRTPDRAAAFRVRATRERRTRPGRSSSS